MFDAMGMTETQKKESLCRFHKIKNMCFCKNENESVQKTCKWWDSTKGRGGCLYWDLQNGVVVNGFRHCRHPEAQAESYKDKDLQVDK